MNLFLRLGLMGVIVLTRTQVRIEILTSLIETEDFSKEASKVNFFRF